MVANLSFAQITLDVEIKNSSSNFEQGGAVSLEEAGEKDYIWHNDTLSLFNMDGSSYSETKIDSSTFGIQDYYGGAYEVNNVLCISQFLFDNDEEIEFLIIIYA